MTATQFIELDVPVERDENGCWYNPKITDFDGDNEKYAAWVEEQRLELCEHLHVGFSEEDGDNLNGWNPNPPKGYGWHMLSIGFTEEGEALCIWARRLPSFKKYLTITMPDGSVWGVPTSMIARNRAEYYAHEFNGDVEKSLNEDTIPLFEEDAYSIQDWAVDMNWSDFSGHHVKLKDAPMPDFEDAWLCGNKGYSDWPAK